MKKILTMSLAAAMLLPLASCEDNLGDNPNGNNGGNNDGSTTIPMVKIFAYNLVTSIDDDASKPAVVSSGSYDCMFEASNSAKTVSVVSSAIAVTGGAATFTTAPMSCSQKMVAIDDREYEAIAFTAENPSKSGGKVTGFKGLLTQAAFLPGSAVINDYELLFPSTTGHYAVFDYVLEDLWRVRTFWRDVTFTGATTTSYRSMDAPNENKTYENKNIRYRVVMKTDRGGLTGKADVIFYNAKFAPPAPEITVVLQNLDLTFSASGYKISGQNVIPSMLEAGGLIPTQNYTFNNFELSAVDDLTQATINYKVAGMFNGTFQGACIAK